MEHLKYPIGKFRLDRDVNPQKREQWITSISDLPTDLVSVVSSLSEAQLTQSYREGSWTVKQVIHHVADAHMNAFVRFKLGLTENAPQISPYNETEWAKLADGINAPIEPSLSIIKAVHERWSYLLRSLEEDAFSRTITHPDAGEMTLDTLLQLYAWHGQHHLGHIKLVK